jgi:hypothetical protein
MTSMFRRQRSATPLRRCHQIYEKTFTAMAECGKRHAWNNKLNDFKDNGT